jgi:hypothetical protein
MAKANLALARTCLCRSGRLVRPARAASVRPANSPNIISAAHCVLPHATQDEGVRGYTWGNKKPALHFYCGNPFDTTSTLSVTVPRLWPPLSAVHVRVCHVPFCEAELLIVS